MVFSFASNNKARQKSDQAVLASVQNSTEGSLNAPFPTRDPTGVKAPNLLEGCSFSLCFIGNLQCRMPSYSPFPLLK